MLYYNNYVTKNVTVFIALAAPSVKRFRALRVNETTFNFTFEVFYTGGGDLEQFDIQLQRKGSGTFVLLTNTTPLIQSQTSPRLWYTVVVDPVFDGLEVPRFNITILNAMEQSVEQPILGEVGKVMLLAL